MNAGREMNAAIAENVIGISFPAPAIQCTHLLRPYSTDIATAWEVVEKISETMWIQIYNCLRDPKSLHFQWCCEIEPDKYREAIEILADTAPHAICLAALKAVGVEI